MVLKVLTLCWYIPNPPRSRLATLVICQLRNRSSHCQSIPILHTSYAILEYRMRESSRLSESATLWHYRPLQGPFLGVSVR